MNELEKKALDMIGKQHPFKRTVHHKKRKRDKPKKNQKAWNILMMLKEFPSSNLYISTKDVEMLKWSFNQATGRNLKLIETKHDNIYRLKLA